MNKTQHITFNFGLCSAFATILIGCTTYVEHRSPRTVYLPPPAQTPVVVTPAEPPVVVTPAEPPVVVTPAEPPVFVTPVEAPVVVIHTESDFYEPLSSHGSWVVIGSYGRCWRPTRVEDGWRPYANGSWRRTNAGWYWVSDEPWGWATYHYGRWDWTVEFGWFWVPQTQWAPAWVSWREGAGYVGWAPLPPSARFGSRGVLEFHEAAYAPRAFVFVSEQRLLEPVRPTTVIVNNTTVINQTVNITKVQVVNRTVINEGPRPEVIERKSGRTVEAVPVHALRHQEETEVVARQRTIPSTVEKRIEPPERSGSAPPNTVATRERRQAETLLEPSRELPPPAKKNEVRGVQTVESTPKPARPAVELPARAEGKRATPQIEKPSMTTRLPDPAKRNEFRGAGTPESTGKPASREANRTMGNERQRALEPVKRQPGTEPPEATSKPPQQPATQPAGKRVIPAREKPAASERGGKNAKKKDAGKKGEEKETPSAQPAAPARPPQ